MQGCLNLREYGKAKREEFFDTGAVIDTRQELLYEFRSVQREFSDAQIELFANRITSLFHYLGFSNEWVASVKEPSARELESTLEAFRKKKTYAEQLKLFQYDVALFVDEDGFGDGSQGGSNWSSMKNCIVGLALGCDAFFTVLDKLDQWKTAVEACATYLDRRR